MFIFELIGRLLYGSDYEELSKRANRKNQRENAADRTVETARFTRGLFLYRYGTLYRLESTMPNVIYKKYSVLGQPRYWNRRKNVDKMAF